MSDDHPDLYDLSIEDLTAMWRDWGEPPFRARQLYRQLYVQREVDPLRMTDLSRPLRERLAAATRIGTLRPVRQVIGDKGWTRKILWTLPNGHPLETVLMIYPDRATVCVSSQSGCAMGCVFCATGQLGLRSNLSTGQMVEQVIWAERELTTARAQGASDMPAHVTNVVYMGMGEPFHNYAHWWASVERLHDPSGFNLGARHFTVSTVGLVSGILKLAEEKLPVNLAISLHASDDATRSATMPINRRYPIADVLQATRIYTQKTHRRVSFEYVLLEHQNDEPEQAERLAGLLRPPDDEPLLCHVNLIPWNPVPGTPLGRSSRQRVLAFQRVLQARNVPCTVRVERGTDIAAACGQLAG